MALQGPSGSGKTYSALLIAYGLIGRWDRIVIIDTENNSGDLYAHLGDYRVLPLLPPFTSERFIEAIRSSEQAGMEAIIIDSISHQWEGEGGILDEHNRMAGNSFTNWGKLTPRHNAFVNAMLQSPSHIIATIRSKQDYVLVDKNGKMVPEKVGMRGVQRDNLDYEMTVVLDVDIKHYASASKDRSGLFIDKPPFVITTQTGQLIRDWCGQGVRVEEVEARIDACRSLDELLALYKSYEDLSPMLRSRFTQRKAELAQSKDTSTLNLNSNGRADHRS